MVSRLLFHAPLISQKRYLHNCVYITILRNNIINIMLMKTAKVLSYLSRCFHFRWNPSYKHKQNYHMCWYTRHWSHNCGFQWNIHQHLNVKKVIRITENKKSLISILYNEDTTLFYLHRRLQYRWSRTCRSKYSFLVCYGNKHCGHSYLFHLHIRRCLNG